MSGERKDDDDNGFPTGPGMGYGPKEHDEAAEAYEEPAEHREHEETRKELRETREELRETREELDRAREELRDRHDHEASDDEGFDLEREV